MALDFLKSWGEEVYHSWLRKSILEPLAGERSPDQATSGRNQGGRGRRDQCGRRGGTRGGGRGRGNKGRA